jgi:PAS domain S-box-containing protein
MTDVDQLMVHIGTGPKKHSTAGKPNGVVRKTTLNSRISTLRGHAQSVARSLRHFEYLLNRVPVPFMELDGKARILRTNEECAHLLNGSTKPLPGKSLFTLVAAADNKNLRDSLMMARQSNKPCKVCVSVLKAGKHYPVEMRIRRQDDGDASGFVAVVESAHNFKNTNTAPGAKGRPDSPLIHELVINLNRAAHLGTVADIVGAYCRKAFNSPAGMLFTERDGDLQIVSEWRPGHIGNKQLIEEMMKKGPVTRAFQTGVPMLWHQDRINKSSVSRFLLRLLRRYRCRSVAFLPVGAPTQRPVAVLTILLPEEDQSAGPLYNHLLRLGQIASGCVLRARAYDEALTARAKAENAVQSKDEFLSVLSHELKNPMMPILGWAIALSSGTLPSEKQNLALDGIVRNIRALNYLIEDLFDAARIASGKLRLQLSEMRIQDVAREALTSIQPTVEGKKLRISTDISEAIPPFTADSRRLQQVLVNLLNNAVKFTPAGGSVSLQVRKHGDTVECIVSDTGKGIEREFLPFVFDRFRQGNRTSKVPAAGLGLGLAIVREIVGLHGGSIKAISEGTDKGATFIFRLPTRRRHGRNERRTPPGNESHPAFVKNTAQHPG